MLSPARDHLLPDHHEQMERACLILLGDTYADDPRALIAGWRRFEHLVEAHFGAEEELLLPAYAHLAPAAAAAIRDDHDRIRGLMARLGVEVELHIVRADTIGELVAELRAHTLREDASLYQWAARLPVTWIAAIRDRLVPAPAPHA